MTLRDWIKKKGMTEYQAAEFFEVSQTAIHRYCNDRTPRPEIMLRIKQKSRGEVSETDWMKSVAARVKKAKQDAVAS